MVELAVESLAPLRGGLELAPLVSRLMQTFPDPKSWSVRMRRALVPLDPTDAAVVDRELGPHVVSYADAIRTYDAPAEPASNEVDEVAELAADGGIPLDEESREALTALLDRMGYVRARRVLRAWSER